MSVGTSSHNGSANLLWTGGWDSTFQLLQLLLIHQQQVTPFYLIDAERFSTGLELRAMKRIKERLFSEYPHTRDLLQPTHYYATADVAPDEEITTAFQSILKKQHIGTQYEWLARFCKQNAIMDMQLCVLHFLEQFVSEVAVGSDKTYRIDPKYESGPEHILFRYFSFPIFHVTKLQIAAMAEERGWKDLMDMTWFCHTPTRHMKPCGRCTPCVIAIKEGLGWRIPTSRRLAAAFQREVIGRVKVHARRIFRGEIARAC